MAKNKRTQPKPAARAEYHQRSSQDGRRGTCTTGDRTTVQRGPNHSQIEGNLEVSRKNNKVGQRQKTCMSSQNTCLSIGKHQVVKGKHTQAKTWAKMATNTCHEPHRLKANFPCASKTRSTITTSAMLCPPCHPTHQFFSY